MEIDTSDKYHARIPIWMRLFKIDFRVHLALEIVILKCSSLSAF